MKPQAYFTLRELHQLHRIMRPTRSRRLGRIFIAMVVMCSAWLPLQIPWMCIGVHGVKGLWAAFTEPYGVNWGDLILFVEYGTMGLILFFCGAHYLWQNVFGGNYILEKCWDYLALAGVPDPARVHEPFGEPARLREAAATSSTGMKGVDARQAY